MKISSCAVLFAFAACADHYVAPQQAPKTTTTTKTKTTTVTRTLTEAETQELASCTMFRSHFDTASAVVKDEDKQSLDSVAACLRANRGIKVSIEGNADERGSAELNEKLANERADAVDSYLRTQGVADKQLGTVSYGQDNPRCKEHNEACWAENRRAAVRPSSATR